MNTSLPEYTLDDLIEWAKTCRYFQPEDFEKLVIPRAGCPPSI